MKLSASTKLVDREFPVDAERQLALLLPENAADPHTVFRFLKLYSAVEFGTLLKHVAAGRVYFRGLSSRTWNRIGNGIVDDEPIYKRPGDMYSKDMSRALAYLNGSAGSSVGKTGVLMLCVQPQNLQAVKDHDGHADYDKKYPHDFKADSSRVLAVFYTKVLKMSKASNTVTAARSRLGHRQEGSLEDEALKHAQEMERVSKASGRTSPEYLKLQKCMQQLLKKRDPNAKFDYLVWDHSGKPFRNRKTLLEAPNRGPVKAAVTRLTASLQDMIRAFFRTNPNPDDAQVHAFAAELGLTPEALEKEIFSLYTDCNNAGDVMPAAVMAGIRLKAQPKNGRVQLAYLFAVPVSKAPDEALCRLLGRLQKAHNCSIHFVVSDQIKSGRTVFEVHSDDAAATTTSLVSALQGYGYTVTKAHTTDTVHIQKGRAAASLVFVQHA